MALNDDFEIWRLVPPEAKLEMMAKANSKGMMTALSVIVVGATCSMALEMVWFFWGALLCSPIIFQLSAGKAWRGLKPQTMLQYLAARSAARRYAYIAKSTNLTLDLIFPATLERVFDPNDVSGALEAAINKNKETEVWVALFKDTVVLMSEQLGGAKMEFAQSINDKLKVKSISESGGDYTNDKEVILTAIQPGIREHGEEDLEESIKITSRFPAALVVFEKKLQDLKLERQREANANSLITPKEEVYTSDDMVDDDDDFSQKLFT